MLEGETVKKSEVAIRSCFLELVFSEMMKIMFNYLQHKNTSKAYSLTVTAFPLKIFSSISHAPEGFVR